MKYAMLFFLGIMTVSGAAAQQSPQPVSSCEAALLHPHKASRYMASRKFIANTFKPVGYTALALWAGCNLGLPFFLIGKALIILDQ